MFVQQSLHDSSRLKNERLILGFLKNPREIADQTYRVCFRWQVSVHPCMAGSEMSNTWRQIAKKDRFNTDCGQNDKGLVWNLRVLAEEVKCLSSPKSCHRSSQKLSRHRGGTQTAPTEVFYSRTKGIRRPFAAATVWWKFEAKTTRPFSDHQLFSRKIIM
jgi:hypothetical protein